MSPTSPATFIVTSPLQVINAWEAAIAYDVDDSHLVVMGAAAEAVTQIEGVIARSGFSRVSWRSAAEGLPSGVHSGRVFLGDYRSPGQRAAARVVSRGRPVVLDDGNATLMVARRRQSPLWRLTDQRHMSLTTRAHQRRLPVPGMIHDLRRPAAREHGAIELFSIYQVTGGRSDVHTPNELRHLRDRTPGVAPSAHVFIGSCLVETGIMRAEAYRSIVRRATECGDGNVLYIPHRREDPANVERLQRDFGFEVMHGEVPVELALLDAGIAPITLTTALSTALDTLGVIFPQAEQRWWPPAPAALHPPYRRPVQRLVDLRQGTELVVASEAATAATAPIEGSGSGVSGVT